jgi:hypothetical protein
LPKAELINQIAHARNYSSYLEICTPTTGCYFRDIEHGRFDPCHRLMYRCPADFADGLRIDFRSPDLKIEGILDQIAASGTRYDAIFVDPWHAYDTSLRDITEAFMLLNPGGTLIVHDCLPERADLATPHAPPDGMPWFGVTYKAFLDFVLGQRLDYLTVDTDYGCGIITKTETNLAGRPLPPTGLLDAWRAIGNDFEAAYRLLESHGNELLKLESVDTFVQRLWFGLSMGASGESTRPPLRQKGNIIGNVDEVSQCDDGRIVIAGWAFDLNFSSAPVWVYSLCETDVVLETATAGARPDVTHAFPDHAPKNARFSVLSRPLPPRPDHRILTFAVNMYGEFAVIGNNSVHVRRTLQTL